MSTTHLHFAPRLRMSGAIHLFPLYAFVLWRGANLVSLISIVKQTKSHKQTMYVYYFILSLSSIGVTWGEGAKGGANPPPNISYT
jgi:hypothetical protein